MKKPKQTPVYIFKPDKVQENIKIFDEFNKCKIKVFYAVKANNYTPLVLSYIKAGYGFDVASIEELNYVLSLGANVKRISFSAPTKLVEDIKKASKLGVMYYAFDSISEIKKIVKHAKDPKLIARIITHNEDAAFDLSAKFGMDPDYYQKVLKKAHLSKWPIMGVTFHVGSQNTSITSWRKALKSTQEFIDFATDHNVVISILNIGGGIPAKYQKGIKDSKFYVKSICSYIKAFKKHNPRIKTVVIEPGRAMAANTMDLITKVVNIKDYKKPSLIVADTSIFNGIIEPLEHFEYEVEVWENHRPRRNLKFYKLAGISCDGYDIIKKKCLLPKDLILGDYLVIKNAGAYTFVYENFHMRKFPKIIE